MPHIIRKRKMEEKKVLIVDDNDAVRKSLKIIVSRSYSNVITLKDPKLIPSVIASGDVDLVILDMNFAATSDGREGLFWLKRIKESAIETLPPAVVMITAYGDINLAVQSLKEGADDFIQKPWDNDRLMHIIAAAMQKHDENRAKISHLPSPKDITGQSPQPLNQPSDISIISDILERKDRDDMTLMTLENMEKRLIQAVLKKNRSNLSEAAEILGITRQTLYNKIKKYGL